MKIAPFLLPVLAAAVSQDDGFNHPQRLTYNTLTAVNDGNESLLNALSYDGLVSITAIPNFSALKQTVLRHFASCLLDRDATQDQKSVVFQDGTTRRSFAFGKDDIASALKDLPETSSCEAFASSIVPFRSAVDAVVESFARRLSAEIGSSLMQPLLTGARQDERPSSWNTVEEIVAAREYLDHFHSYQKLDDREHKTIEFHVDQGLFLAFAPGMVANSNSRSVAGLSEGFYVRDMGGKEYDLMFDECDDLVFMLGDGVNQYINNKLTTDDSTKVLYAPPHALTLKTHQDPSLSRVWFGRMILPPQDAFVPSSGDSTTFGQIRRDIIQHFATSVDFIVGIGCSSPELQLGLHGVPSISRNLQGHGIDASMCAEDELFCWFRCMPLADHELTITTCSERNLQLQCANPRDQVVPDGQQHGDYFPACTNSTDPVTDYPLIKQQDNLTCPDLWEEFAATDELYDHVADLTVPNGPETQLMWSVTDDNKIKARLVHNNVFGWLAVGFADPNGDHNGMNGGQILLATPFGTENYSPVTGLDNSTEAMIATYVIDANDSSFRHWMDPIETDEAISTVADFETDDCSTAISFESNHINGKEFNINGTDDMIWAGNSIDYYVGYHGPFSRLRFTIDWRSGEVTPYSTPEEEDEGHDEESHADNIATTSNSVTVDIEDIASGLAKTDGDTSDSMETKETESGASYNAVWIATVIVASFSMFV
ncbi:hypothetical protein ACHAW6_012672 [Cyclotella cf. meneghiniana]